MIPITKISDEAKGIMLTQANEIFECLFSFRIEPNYKISSIDNAHRPRREGQRFSTKEKRELFEALCRFLDETTDMTYTEVENKYGRKPDATDTATDSQSGEEFPMEHYQLSEKGLGSIARIHGYIRNGVFVVKRLDWAHDFHKMTPNS